MVATVSKVLEIRSENWRRSLTSLCLLYRLKITLNLPPIEPRPPVPPRVYKRIYSLLDKELPVSSLAGRPRLNGRSTSKSQGLSSPVSRGTPSRATPTKETSLSQFRAPANAGKSSRFNLKSASKQKDSELPPWIRSTVRHICTALLKEDGPDLAPTVEAGLDAIIAPYRNRTQDEWVNAHLTALVGAIYLYVSQSAALAPGEKMTTESFQVGYKSARKEILAALRVARNDIQVPTTITRGKKAEVTEDEETAFWAGWQESIKVADFDQAVQEVANRDWLSSDWYRSIDFLRDQAEHDDEGVDAGETPTSAAATVQIMRADMMLQDKFDYLSDRRRADYRKWEADILRRIELLESDQRPDVMDIDT
ncbi:hypothetical protein N0V82_007856 [Gnomoniopsis sp. IMI 355080]|nr:hypothetical protein N0V82_007856 [Gnomoniopsis sp. IMI 355080]